MPEREEAVDNGEPLDGKPGVVSKVIVRTDGRRTESHYAIGPRRATAEEAMADAGLFERLPELRA